MTIAAGSDINASDFVSTSAGSGDSGKVLKLDSNGLLDKSGYGVHVFVADEDLTAGQTVGISNYSPSGRVARAKRTTTSASISGHTVNDPPTEDDHACEIGGDKFVMLTCETGTDTLFATVGSMNFSTKAVTLGTPVAVTTDQANGATYQAVCKLGTDKFVVFYREDASTTIIKYRIATVSGTTITFGSAATYYTAASAIYKITCDYLATDKAVMVVACNGVVTDSRIVVCTVSGTTATPGTAASIGTTIDDSISSCKVKKIDTDKFMLAASSGYAQIYTCSGTTVNASGTQTQFSALGGQNYHNILVLTTTLVVIYFRDGSNIGQFTAGTISGTTPTFGSTLQGNQYDSGLALDSSTSFLVGSYNNNQISKYTISGTTLTYVGVVVGTAPATYILAVLSSGTISIYINSSAIDSWVLGMSNMFHGIVENTVSRGGNARVRFYGINSNQSGLIPGRNYQPNGTGGLSAISTNAALNTADDRYVTAVSSTEVMIGMY